MHLQETFLGEKQSWNGLDDWRKIISMRTEDTACLGWGYRKELVQRSFQLTARREKQCGGKRKELCGDEFGEADLNKSHRRVFSQEIIYWIKKEAIN